jgi:hypothetical protein
MLLYIRDETRTGQSLHELTLEFLTEKIGVRELIRERVHHEVKEFNRRGDEFVFRGLVQPTGAEQILNGRSGEYRLKERRTIDWEEQFTHGLDGFAKNRLFVLIKDQQAESLDQEFVIGPVTLFVRRTFRDSGYAEEGPGEFDPALEDRGPLQLQQPLSDRSRRSTHL